jgi:hypothetical protein
LTVSGASLCEHRCGGPTSCCGGRAEPAEVDGRVVVWARLFDLDQDPAETEA